MLEKTDQLIIRDAFTGAMRNVANSVTVVTTDGSGGRHGATVSSFCSVSADPPTILVCLNKTGQTAKAVIENKNFCVNVLPENAVETARSFAGIPLTASQEDPFDTINWHSSENAQPVFNDVTAFVCSKMQIVSATSHYIIIGKVEFVQSGLRRPLIYLNQEFCGVSTD
ncbi:MAG: flavin reductase family protein [Pseudomonadota bacterium]